jgi:hypothetical protein
MKKIKRPISRLKKKSNRGFRGYPVATIAFYGPTADRATKIAIFKVSGEGSEPELLDRWILEEGDVRRDPVSEGKVLALLRDHQILTVAMADRLLGCPHEESIDYPDGQSCPQCPFWASRDRFTHERIH